MKEIDTQLLKTLYEAIENTMDYEKGTYDQRDKFYTVVVWDSESNVFRFKEVDDKSELNDTEELVISSVNVTEYRVDHDDPLEDTLYHFLNKIGS